MTAQTPQDPDLVAYLDGELDANDRARVELAMNADPRVAARLVALSMSTSGLKAAFDPVLAEAPMARMLASLGDPVGEAATAALGVTARTGGVSRRWMIAAGIGLVALGGLADHLVLSSQPGSVAADSGHWRDIVARYVRLYTAGTLANVPDDPALRARELASVGRAIGLHLTVETVTLGQAAFKQARILRYDTTPLAEINYLDPRDGPMSLCILPSSRPSRAPQLEIRHGLNVSYWNDGRHGFMVIGALPAADLGTIAQTLAGRFSALRT